jgi:transglutaminase-like putative cysteine protease
MRVTHLIGVAVGAGVLAYASGASAATPQWVRAQVSALLPAHDDETPAVLLYYETQLTVQGTGKIRRLERKVYKILRREGEDFGLVRVDFDSQSRVTALRGWSIPAQGKDFETRDKDVAESGLTGIEGGELVSDARSKLLRIPAATTGSIIAYEVEQEQRPYVLSDEWEFQETVPVREARYSIQMPAGWSYKAFWLNHSEESPSTPVAGQWSWTVMDVKPIKLEGQMPPWRGIAGKMALSFLPPGGQQGGFQTWQEMGTWYVGLTRGRRDASPEIKQKVQELTGSVPTMLGKMTALAGFVQRDIRYVAIELGIGGVQPHPATDVFRNRYGDCKDKATLLSSMLKEIGVDSHYVIINTVRGSFTETTPPNLGFNHAILAIQLPADVDLATLPAVMKHPKLGQVLFFDPTQPLIPFGRLPGALQANYGMLVTPDGGELLRLPQLPAEANGVKRTAKLVLNEAGTLQGDVIEVWSGDMAAEQRYALRSVTQDIDQIKPVESMLSHSLGTFSIQKAAIRNLRVMDQPLEWHYSLEAERYAKAAGDLILVRPRVMSSRSSALLETKEPRQHPIEFDAPEHDTDVFEITLPAGYVVDDLPPAVNEDLGFVSYHSTAQVTGRVLRYTRSFEIKELSVPLAKVDKLKQFYRVIADDERNSAVLKRSGP